MVIILLLTCAFDAYNVYILCRVAFAKQIGKNKMKPKKTLSEEEHRFFSLVHQVVLSNPFGDRRVEIDLKIAGLFPGISDDERIQRTIEEVDHRIKRLKDDNRDDLRLHEGHDRVILKYSFLYNLFYTFIDDFDAHIVDQIESGKTPVKVIFADKALSHLCEKGFGRQEACRYFALCYQLRRAFYFIEKRLVGRCPCMKKMRERLWNNVFTSDLELYDSHLWDKMEDFTTLILGETGTGKGTTAMAIGSSGFIPFDDKKKVFSESFTESFVSLNLSQFSAGLIESEMFGHKKGAFTGAVEDHEGVFNRCSPFGAIFLDEIGEVSVPVQIKLLKVLEERCFSPVGSHQEYRFKGRIIAATNRSLSDISDTQVMREDLFYRLCSDIIIVPPLRQRVIENPKELDELLAFKIEKLIGSSHPDLIVMVRGIIDQQLGRDYSWPGNVRELEQCLKRILLNRNYETISRTLQENSASRLATAIDRGELDAHSLIKGYCHMLYSRFRNYGEVARRTKLDRRTVKKYIDQFDRSKDLLDP